MMTYNREQRTKNRYPGVVRYFLPVHIFSALLSFLFFFLSSFVSAQSGGLFWEEPVLFSGQQSTFPVSAYSDNLSAVAWQESVSNRINVHLAVKSSGENWQQRGVVGGPYSYSGTEPAILSMVIDNQERIIIAAATVSAQVEILISSDRGLSFTRQTINMGAENSVAPRIFVSANGGYLLFVSRGRGESLTIYYSRSSDAVNWSDFELFTTESSLALNFLPTHASSGRRDMVFFQSLTMGGGQDASTFFQLYYKTSDDGGRSWSQARRFTTFNDPVSYTSASPLQFDNQRPHLTRYGNNFFLVWERRYSNQSPQIYCAVINPNGNIVGSVERLNTDEAYCNNPIGFIYGNNPVAVWFDNRRGNNRVILAQRGDLGWQNHILSGAGMESSFARPAVSRDGVYILWQQGTSARNRIYILSPDRTVSPPRIIALNFNPSRAGRLEMPQVSWTIPSDTSGIQGFSWSWSQDINIVPAQYVMTYNTGNTQNLLLDLNADNEGEWYFKVSALDWAGNWSEPAQIMYMRKATPPPQVVLNEPALDDNGFISSNNFRFTWEESADPYIAGYTWDLRYLGINENALNIEAASFAPPPAIMGTDNFAFYENQDNGYWSFTVAAIDQAGNIGPASSTVFRANKFIPYTNVNYVDANQDEQGRITIRLFGRGFMTNGIIDSIALTQSGQPDILADSFNVVSDREITGILFENAGEGTYNLRLHHPSRGWYETAPFISAERTGTVKFGDYSRLWEPSWTIQNIFTLNPVTVLTVIFLFFCLLGAIAAIRGISGIIQEGQAIKLEAQAIITGDFMPMEKKQKLNKIHRRGGGLRLKLASFTIALVLLVVIMVSTPMYILMTNMQRETLLQGLWDRSKVLLEGLATSSKAYMPQGNEGLIELGFLPAQSSALPEANYVTITGFGIGSIHNDHVLATNDPNIGSKIDTAEYQRAVSRITDDLTPIYEQINEYLNSQAQELIGDIAASIIELNREAISLALRTDAESRQRVIDIQTAVNQLSQNITETLAEISGEIGSFPEFTIENIENNNIRTFILYKPVVFQQGNEENYLRGFIRLEVSIDSIMDAISDGQFVLLRTIVIVALSAIFIGLLFAIIISNLIVRPVRKLVRHIEKIRDTEDKAKLAGVDIEIKSKDEIAILGNTINDMTHGLVKAALAASDLSIGKEIQKKFIPLEVDSRGNKQTSGFKKTQHLNFFGYYEGAKGVSGDYFDYQELEGGRYFAIIKCDVAGKGIPAALIMIQVATMFLNHFKQWKPDAKGMKLEDIVYQINDFIEALGFKGRFAAFSLCVFDSVTGIVRFCNAGDNIIHYYDASEGKKKTITLPQTPATGVLPNFMIESTGGYKVSTVQIDKDDILLLYTDGIEESKRRFRDSNFKEIICTEGPADTPHENHLSGQADEEMSPERVDAIINAVMAKEIYTLKKYHNPEGETELQFDFTSCEGKVEDVIMAMVSVEKIFRMYKDPKAGEDSKVLVDIKVDEFLKNHFLQYRRYCSYTRECPDNPAYMYYTHVMEDEQYDDLTILGIKRK